MSCWNTITEPLNREQFWSWVSKHIIVLFLPHILLLNGEILLELVPAIERNEKILFSNVVCYERPPGMGGSSFHRMDKRIID